MYLYSRETATSGRPAAYSVERVNVHDAGDVRSAVTNVDTDSGRQYLDCGHQAYAISFSASIGLMLTNERWNPASFSGMPRASASNCVK